MRNVTLLKAIAIAVLIILVAAVIVVCQFRRAARVQALAHTWSRRELLMGLVNCRSGSTFLGVPPCEEIIEAYNVQWSEQRGRLP